MALLLPLPNWRSVRIAVAEHSVQRSCFRASNRYSRCGGRFFIAPASAIDLKFPRRSGEPDWIGNFKSKSRMNSGFYSRFFRTKIRMTVDSDHLRVLAQA